MKFRSTTEIYTHIEQARVALNGAVFAITRQGMDRSALEFGSQLSELAEALRTANTLLGHVDDIGLRFVVQKGSNQETKVEDHAKKKTKATRSGRPASDLQGAGAVAKTILGVEGESGRRDPALEVRELRKEPQS